MNDFKKRFLKFLEKTDLKVLIFAGVFFVLIVMTSVSLIKIHSTGGMAKAQKDAEIAYNHAAEKDNKNKDKKNSEPVTEETTTEKITPTVTQAEDNSETQTETSSSKTPENIVLTEKQLELINKYYGSSAFVGDSVMLGFANYAEKKGDDFLGGPLFLVAGSFSLRNALYGDNSDVLPTYKGEKMKVEDALAQAEGIDKVFLFFGINDFNVVEDPINDVFKEYIELIERIKEKKDVQINVISTTYILYGKDSGALNNSNVEKLNKKMQDYCKFEGYGFVDIAQYLGDSVNGLKAEYCSDGYLHESVAAYDVWTNVLQQFALDK